MIFFYANSGRKDRSKKASYIGLCVGGLCGFNFALLIPETLSHTFNEKAWNF